MRSGYGEDGRADSVVGRVMENDIVLQWQYMEVVVLLIRYRSFRHIPFQWQNISFQVSLLLPGAIPWEDMAINCSQVISQSPVQVSDIQMCAFDDTIPSNSRSMPTETYESGSAECVANMFAEQVLQNHLVTCSVVLYVARVLRSAVSPVAGERGTPWTDA